MAATCCWPLAGDVRGGAGAAAALHALAVPLYALGVALLVATALFGITKKGATRWLNLGVVIQPSEILKIATPLMLAWWFQKREGSSCAARLRGRRRCCWPCRWAGRRSPTWAPRCWCCSPGST
jgi:hypothetical protein